MDVYPSLWKGRSFMDVPLVHGNVSRSWISHLFMENPTCSENGRVYGITESYPYDPMVPGCRTGFGKRRGI
jgi:hypothetical protein